MSLLPLLSQIFVPYYVNLIYLVLFLKYLVILFKWQSSYPKLFFYVETFKQLQGGFYKSTTFFHIRYAASQHQKSYPGTLIHLNKNQLTIMISNLYYYEKRYFHKMVDLFFSRLRPMVHHSDVQFYEVGGTEPPDLNKVF